MPRRKSGLFDQKKYEAQYIKDNIKYRKMNLNILFADDRQMLEWIDSQPEGTSNYFKRLVKKDMEGN